VLVAALAFYEGVGAIECVESYGRLEDIALPGQRHVICNSEERLQQVLVSRGHIVRLWFDDSTRHRSRRRFLIQYSGIYFILLIITSFYFLCIYSATFQRLCSCGMRLEALYKSYMPLPLPTLVLISDVFLAFMRFSASK